jgi:hypothetical protein
MMLNLTYCGYNKRLSGVRCDSVHHVTIIMTLPQMVSERPHLSNFALRVWRPGDGDAGA